MFTTNNMTKRKSLKKKRIAKKIKAEISKLLKTKLE
jgi:hypothetical protein